VYVVYVLSLSTETCVKPTSNRSFRFVSWPRLTVRFAAEFLATNMGGKPGDAGETCPRWMLFNLFCSFSRMRVISRCIYTPQKPITEYIYIYIVNLLSDYYPEVPGSIPGATRFSEK
jgi:hypothetical protein